MVKSLLIVDRGQQALAVKAVKELTGPLLCARSCRTATDLGREREGVPSAHGLTPGPGRCVQAPPATVDHNGP